LLGTESLTSVVGALLPAPGSAPPRGAGGGAGQ
jgi:hypothetical protein